MNLQEHIRKVLKENHTDKMIKLIDNYIKTFYPYFNSKDVGSNVKKNYNLIEKYFIV